MTKLLSYIGKLKSKLYLSLAPFNYIKNESKKLSNDSNLWLAAKEQLNSFATVVNAISRALPLQAWKKKWRDEETFD